MEDEPVVSELQTEEVGGGEEAMCISPEPSPPPPPYISERSHSPSPPPPPRISSPEQKKEDEPDEVQGEFIIWSYRCVSPGICLHSVLSEYLAWPYYLLSC